MQPRDQGASPENEAPQDIRTGFVGDMSAVAVSKCTTAPLNLEGARWGPTVRGLRERANLDQPRGRRDPGALLAVVEGVIMRDWHTVSRHHPCSICEKADWCSVSTDGTLVICRRVDTGAGIYKVDKAGAEYWLYRLDGHTPSRQPIIERPSQPCRACVECADAATLDRVYRALLTALPLASTHRQALRQRGLADRKILRYGYRTLPAHTRATRAHQLVEDFGAEVCAHIPGLYLADRGGRRWWSLARATGLLIPVRNLDGHIVALKVRADAPGDSPKYTTISSAKHGGPSPGAHVHLPLHDGLRGDMVRLTEGELKADVATVLSGFLTLSVPGVAMWRQALPVLQHLQAPQVLLAFDADWRTNPHVAHALGQAAFALVKAGYEVQVEDWDPGLGKGIDDLLAAGHSPAVQSVALAFGAGFRGQARIGTGPFQTKAAEEIPSWQ